MIWLVLLNCQVFRICAELSSLHIHEMSEKYKFNDPEGMYFVTMATVGWVDVFTRPELKQIVINSLRYCQKEKGLVINAWCLMSSHLHMIVRTDKDPLYGIIRDFKKFTALKIIEAINSGHESRRDWMLELFSDVADRLKRVSNYKIWQDGNHPELLMTGKFIKQKLDYIHNPVAEEIVDEAENYLYSSARDYYTDQKGYLAIEFIE